jgi:sulfite reductase alpha subunit-like flavoprotein
VVDPWITQLWTVLPNIVERNKDKAKSFEEKEFSCAHLSKNVKENLDPQESKESDVISEKVSSIQINENQIQQKQINEQAVGKEEKEEARDLQQPVVLSLGDNPLENVSQLTHLPKINSSILDIQWTLVKREAAHTLFDYLGEFSFENAFDYTETKPFKATLVAANELTSLEANKKVWELVLNIQSLNWNYQPGDAFAIHCPNPDSLVFSILKRLELDPFCVFEVVSKQTEEKKLFNLVKPSTPYEVFKYVLDLHTLPTKSFFRFLAEFAKDAQEKKILLLLCSKQGKKSS